LYDCYVPVSLYASKSAVGPELAPLGQTIGKFVQQIMIERARLLLSESDDPIKTVAAKLGFSSPTAFATAFRRSCGLSPQQFRTHCTTAPIE
jgi:AraC-like DNA-binding protein